MKIRCCFKFALGMLLAASVASAQGRLLGRVTDADGAPLVAAVVSINGSKTGAVVTNGQGYYTFLGLPEGSYTVRVSKRGLNTRESGVTLAANSTVMLNVKLMSESAPTLAENVAVKDEVKESAARVERRRERPVEKPKPAPKITGAEKEPEKKDAEKPVLVDAPAAATPAMPKADSLADAPTAVALVGKIEDAGLQKAIADAEVTEKISRKVVEKSASVVGGIEAIYKNLQYPPSARNTAREVNVVAKVFVDENGKVIKVDMIKTAAPAFNEEVYRVLTEDTQFTPAEVDSKPTAGVVTIVVNFKP